MSLAEVKQNLIIISHSKIVFLFISIVLLDIFLGIFNSLIQGKTNSSIGLKGLLKHSVVIITSLIVAFYLMCFNLEVLARTFLLFFIVEYLFSLVETWGEMGLPLPSWVIKKIEKLHTQYDKGDENN